MAPQRNCRWEREWVFPGSAASTAIAGIAVTRWRICVTAYLHWLHGQWRLCRVRPCAQRISPFHCQRRLDDVHVAPLLCAGIIGYRSLRVAGVERGERVGLYGFGSSACLAITILQSWECEVYVVTRGDSHRKPLSPGERHGSAMKMARPPVELDRAITFAPSGKVVVAALASLRKGGVVAINAIHLDQMPGFDYDKLLWGERQIRSVANMTPTGCARLAALARDLNIRPRFTVFPLEDANKALLAVKRGNGVWLGGDCSLKTALHQ